MPGATDGLVTLQKSYKAVLPWHQSGLANLQRTAIDGMELALHFSNKVRLMEQGFPTTRLPMAVLPCHGFELAPPFFQKPPSGLPFPPHFPNKSDPMTSNFF